jgi:hypothetical protein
VLLDAYPVRGLDLDSALNTREIAALASTALTSELANQTIQGNCWRCCKLNVAR